MPSKNTKSNSRPTPRRRRSVTRTRLAKPVTEAAYALAQADALSLVQTIQDFAKQWRERVANAHAVLHDFHGETRALTDADNIVTVLEQALSGMRAGSATECHACKGVAASVRDLLPTLRAPWLHKMQDVCEEVGMYSGCFGQLASLFHAMESGHEAHLKQLAELGNFTANSYAELFAAVQANAQAFISEHAGEVHA